MPRNQQAERASRQEFPVLVEQIGEDPARFLDKPALGGSKTGSPLMLARARIRGIDSLEILRAWRAVERGIDRGPREQVMKWLDDRESQLGAVGERSDRPTEREDRNIPEKVVLFVDEDGNELDRSRTARSKLASLATDGGESR